MWGETKFHCIGYDNTAYVEYMDLTLCCPKKAVKFNHLPVPPCHCVILWGSVSCALRLCSVFVACNPSSGCCVHALCSWLRFQINNSSLALGRSEGHFKMRFSILFSTVSSHLMIMPSNKCHRNLLMISEHWFRYWLSAIRQQAITWAKVDPDLCHHMASLAVINRPAVSPCGTQPSCHSRMYLLSLRPGEIYCNEISSNRHLW